MPKITINGHECEFKPGQMILQVANENAQAIPQYCYHDGLSIVASCRICLAEVWQPNPRNDNALEAIPKLVPTCQTACSEGMVVYTDSPKAIANQKAVMEYLLINHPLDCPVCDQSGECLLQDYSYEYGRSASRFEEAKVKNPKKDLGPHVYLYADRCIMCTRCVRFTREVTETAELTILGRGNKNEIDIFPGLALDNELSANVVDLCPVGALLDKDFLFAQRVWFLKGTPSIDGITASGDNLRVDSNDGKVYRLKPRTNMSVNKWWISDEVRYGWKHVHSEQRLAAPIRRAFGLQQPGDWNRAYNEAAAGLTAAVRSGGRLGVVVSPMLSCEDAFELARLALQIDPRTMFFLGPVPVMGQDKTFPPADPAGFKVYAEKAPNARGVRRVLSALCASTGNVASLAEFNQLLSAPVAALLLTGNYPTDWTTGDLLRLLRSGASPGGKKPFVVLIDTLAGPLAEAADVVLPSCTWLEKAGSFQNARDQLQAFEQAIPPVHSAKSEGQIALDLAAILAGSLAVVEGETVVITPDKAGQVPDATRLATAIGEQFNAAGTRARMAAVPGLEVFAGGVAMPVPEVTQEPDVQMVEI